MSSRVLPGRAENPFSSFHVGQAHPRISAQAKPHSKVIVRRRPNPLQGRALEILGHAIEYLVDSYIAGGVHLVTRADDPDQQAAQILMQLNRDVFAECEEIKPLSTRIREWLHLS
ncbi:MAG: hypothetical protein ACYC46_13985 [Acidobacteriaceae bacterium]